MKTITIITSILLFLFAPVDETKTIEATYDGYEDGTYYFTDSNDDLFEFQQVEKAVLKEFDLMSNTFENKKFKVTYKTVEEEVDDEEYTSYVITALTLIKE
ncbi:hypothetical protein EZY14_005025 [Kordia sp. TARA_039_SRF]|nr:hypothetical protein EZY14_005025 [Kordia sp. TARA_039_SRF]